MLGRMRGSRPALLLAAAALLLLVVFAARGESPVPTSISDATPDRGLPPVFSGPKGPSLGQATPNTVDPELVGTIVVVVAGLLLVLAVVLSILSARRARLRTPVGTTLEQVEGTIDFVSRGAVTKAVADARDLLARPGGEPGDAVVRAWLTLEHATEHGRAPHQTATEFTVALLERETADAEALRELRTLYQRARFGARDEITEQDVGDARQALDRILATVR